MRKTQKFTYDKIERHAPKFRKHKYTTYLFNKTLHQEFIAEHPSLSYLSYKEWKKLWDNITETVRYEVVHNPLGVQLSHYLGELKAQYIPYKFKAEDLSLSYELGERVTHKNINTRDKTAKIKWERRDDVKRNRMLQFYAFDPDKRVRMMAYKYIDENPEKVRVSRNTLGGRRTWR